MSSDVIRRLAAANPVRNERPLQLLEPRRAVHRPRRWRFVLVAASATAVAALIALAAIAFATHPSSPTAAGSQHPRGSGVRLSGGTIQLASYRFRLPAGFRASTSACQFSLPAGLQPLKQWLQVQDGGFSAAASAEGGCVEALLIAGGSPVPSEAEQTAVGPYTGFLASPGSSQEVLYVQIPAAQGDHYLVLLADGLTSEELVAIAQSGLPTSIEPTQTCTANCG
jgi:hypothetical protein